MTGTINLTVPVCTFCQQPADAEQPLIGLKDGLYEHPICGNQYHHQVSEVSIPTGEYCQDCHVELDEMEVEHGQCVNCLLDQQADLADFRYVMGW